MTVKYYYDIAQNTDEWIKLRCGVITASELKNVLTPTLKLANNDKTRLYIYNLIAEKISKFSDDTFQNWDMERGHYDEIEVKNLYSCHYELTQDCGFITNDKWGFKLGYSPDALVGENGLIEAKSRMQKHHIKIVIDNEVPKEHYMQCQGALLISERDWIDYISYSGGHKLFVKRVFPDLEIHEKLIDAAKHAYDLVDELTQVYMSNAKDFIDTEKLEYDLEIK